MNAVERTKAQQIAEAAVAFEKARTGHAPKSVTVVLGGDTLVITLTGALSPAERVLAATPTGAAEVQAYRRKLFDTAADTFREQIRAITGVEVRETTAEVEPVSGTVVTVFTTGTLVQVYLLGGDVPTETFTGDGVVLPTV